MSSHPHKRFCLSTPRLQNMRSGRVILPGTTGIWQPEAVPEIISMTVRRGCISTRVRYWTLQGVDFHLWGIRDDSQETYGCVGGGTSGTAPASEYSHPDTAPETLRMMRDMRREMSDMQAELLAHREHQGRARQPGPDAKILDHWNASRDADSHI
ncbi:hypothetical protein Tco_0618612 [Tanacetum coccineum]